MMKHKKIAITNHAKERYILRFKDIYNKHDINIYLKKHEDTIIRDLNRMYKYSEFIYYGKTDQKHQKRAFFINNDIILVMKNNLLITVYKVEYDLHDSKDVLNNLINTIQKNNDLYNYQKQVIQNSKKRINRYTKAYNNSTNHLERVKALLGIQVAYADNLDFNEDLDNLVKKNQEYASRLIGYDDHKIIVN